MQQQNGRLTLKRIRWKCYGMYFASNSVMRPKTKTKKDLLALRVCTAIVKGRKQTRATARPRNVWLFSVIVNVPMIFRSTI